MILNSLFLIASSFAGSVSITQTAVTDSAGVSRSFFSSSERINLRIESYCSVPVSPERIYYRFYIKNPSGAQVFKHDSNSTEGNTGSGAAALRNIPMTFYSGPGLYRFRAELVVGGAIVAFDESKSFTVFSPVITLTYPPDAVKDLLDKPVTFRWVASGASKYRVLVGEERSFYKPMWTGETPASYIQYPLNPPEDRQRLSGGMQYYWKVEGVSSDGRKVASSDVYAFTLKKEAVSVSYRNLAVTGLEYDPMSAPPERVLLKTEISNMGNQSETAVKLNLFVGGILSGFTQINSLMPQEKVSVVFEIAPVLQENIIATVMILSADENPRDNVLTRSFRVNLPEEWRNVPKILGRVVEEGTGNGIPGIRLKLEGPTARESVTGSGGQYKFEKLLRGQYKISVSAEGIKGESISVNVTEDKAYTGNKISVAASAELQVPEIAEEDSGTEYSPGEAWKIIRGKIKDKNILSALEGYKVSDISINSGSVKEAVDAIKEGELKIKSAEVEIIR